MTYNIDEVEKRAILALGAFALVWTLWVVPYLATSPWFNGQNPLMQYLIYNLGLLAALTVLVGVPVAYFLEKDINVWFMLKGGIAAFLIFSFILDMAEPPFSYDNRGNILITNSSALPTTAGDRAAGYIWSSLGASGTWLYYSVYIMTPIIAALGAALLLKPREFLARLHGG